jgi:hypothetical protein
MRKRAIEMPTEIRRPSAQIIEQTRAPEAPPLSLTLLGTIAILTLVLHLATGAVLYSSHAGEIAPMVVGAAGEQAICASEAKPLERALPFD